LEEWGIDKVSTKESFDKGVPRRPINRLQNPSDGYNRRMDKEEERKKEEGRKTYISLMPFLQSSQMNSHLLRINILLEYYDIGIINDLSSL
jgi:hypothetical protein